MKRFAGPLAVGFVSAGALGYEILLVRLFAIEQFHHFAYMAITVAMLGFGATGTFLALAKPLDETKARRTFAWAALLSGVALSVSPGIVSVLSPDMTQIAWDSGEWVKLAAVYVVLGAPFALAALVTVLGIAGEPDRPGLVYGASFIGSGLGAVSAVLVLWLAAPPEALALPVLLVVPGGAAAVRMAGWKRTRAVPSVAALAALAVLPTVAPRRITPYKGLPQALALPKATLVAEHTSPVGWVTAVRAEQFRLAPGLSLAYRGSFPRQTGIFVDGETRGAVYDWRSDSQSVELLEWLPSAIPFVLGPADRVLVFGADMELWSAVHHGASSVTVVELDPFVLRLARSTPTPPAWEVGDRVSWIAGDPRSSLDRLAERFDAILVGPIGGLGGASAGIYSLNEDFLHTVEAYVACLRRLSESGVLAITAWMETPPRSSVRAILTVARALEEVSPGSTARALAVVRTWGTATVLAKPSGFTPAEIAALESWSDTRRFDVDWRPGLDGPRTGYNQMDDPVLYRAAVASIAGGEAVREFRAGYPFEVSPVSDARPYPRHFLGPGSARRLLSVDVGEWLPFAEWGYLSLVATLAQAILVAGALTLLPAILRRPLLGAGMPSLVGYFGSVGAAYLMAEIAAIQQLGLLLGHPVYAVTAVLAAMLLGSGAGSLWSDRLELSNGWRVALALSVVIAVLGLLLLDVVHLANARPLVLRLLVACAFLLPLSFLMGQPFALGLRLLAEGSQTRLAWAWGVNGFASVVAAPLGALIVLDAGSRALFFVAAAGYGVAALLYFSHGRRAMTP